MTSNPTETEQPLVSIVLPTFNGSRYLAESLQSIIDQTYQRWELIVVDDASSDRTPEIVKSYCDKDARIRTIRHATNRRLPAGLNTGFADARGQYLTWTSDDNRYRPQALERMVGFLKANPAVGIVYCNCTIIDEDGREKGNWTASPPEELTCTCAVGACFLYPSAVRDAIGNYADDLFLAEDWDYWMRASMRFKLAVLQEDLYEYRAHSGSLSSTRVARVREATETLLLRHLPHMGWAGREAQAAGWCMLASLAAEAGRRSEGLRRLGKAIRISPSRVIRRHPGTALRLICGQSAWSVANAIHRKLRHTTP